MAKVPALPAQVIIDKAGGILDYYVHDGQPCVRMWPRKKRHPPTPQEKDQWPAFTYVNQAARELPANVVATWKRLATGTALTWKDYLCRCYIGATFNPPGYPKTFPDFTGGPRWLITKFHTTRTAHYINLYCTTDTPTVLWAAKFDHEAHFVPVIRILRGAHLPVDKQLVYHRFSFSGEVGANAPRLNHRLRFYIYGFRFYGTYLVSMSALGWPQCISQIFLEEDFPT